MENYQKKLDRELETLGGRKPGLLLHSCCGPCSTYVLEYLSRCFELGLLYYDPNIQPEAEYELRLENQRAVLERFPGVRLHEYGWRGADYEAVVRGLESEPEGGARCTVCFRLRLEETARLAKELGYEYFCTTLSVSPHKDAERINRIGAELAEKYSVKWLPSDFKKREGYKRSIELSREYGLYRQEYCGCLYSKPVEK